jgi:hypothetical protein
MSAQQEASSNPTKTLYFAKNGGLMRFKWTESRPRKGAWLGEVTFGKYVNKPIQIYDAKTSAAGTDWGYQAQQGEFVCRMEVSADQSRITFSRSTKGDWPMITVYAIFGPTGEDASDEELPDEN